MLNRRILRIKAFKVLYECNADPGLSLKDALAILDKSCEATRDLYLFLMSLAGPLTAEALSRIEAAKGKFNPTEEDLNPNLKFVNNALAPLLSDDPDFTKLVRKKKLSWEQNDVFLRRLWDRVSSSEWYRRYMDTPETSLKEDARLFRRIFESLEDDPDLETIVEDASILWCDDINYALSCCLRSLEDMVSTGRWTLPPLYQSDMLRARGLEADSDRDFVHRLVSVAYAGMQRYSSLISSSVMLKWEADRLFISDILLISLGLAEAETFPEIPVKVSINEYVDISRFYSTPKSSAFVNGLLDFLIRKEMDEGLVKKTGRGLK